jgi:restriction system protein
MAIPKQHELYEPIFRLFSDKGERTLTEVEFAMCKQFSLTTEEAQALKGSGTQRLMSNRCGWATWRLSQPGLISRVGRGLYKITELGSNRAQLSRLLTRAELFTEAEKGDERIALEISQNTDSPNPEESMDLAFQILKLKLADDLLTEVKQRSPKFFENLVVELIVAMGYGGSRAQAGKAVGKTGDNGIDGIISEDKLGLENIYLQAKRYATGSVGEGDIRDFKGALDAKGAKKGVFITTSYFTEAAKIAADKSLNYKIVLIDGERLAELMIEHNLGVSTAVTYELKKVDTDFFSEE